jgi:flagellar protein FlgJ
MDARIDSAQLLNQANTPRPIKVAKGEDSARLKDVAQQFEAIFIQQMYAEMRKTIPDDGLIQRSNADEIYAQLQDQEAARITAQQGGIGLADLMMEQLMK